MQLQEQITELLTMQLDVTQIELRAAIFALADGHADEHLPQIDGFRFVAERLDQRGADGADRFNVSVRPRGCHHLTDDQRNLYGRLLNEVISTLPETWAHIRAHQAYGAQHGAPEQAAWIEVDGYRDAPRTSDTEAVKQTQPA